MLRLTTSSWLVMILIGSLMGICPGLALGQGREVSIGALLGWFLFPMAIAALLTLNTTLYPLAFWGYLLAALGYSVCAYWIVTHTHSQFKGLTMTVGAALISTLMSVFPATLLMSMHQGVNFWRFTMDYLLSGSLPLQGIVLFHLLISATLGWMVGAKLARRRGVPLARANGNYSAGDRRPPASPTEELPG